MPAELKLLPTSLQDKGDPEQKRAPSRQELEQALRSTFEQVLQGATHSDQATFMAYEATLVAQVRQLGQLLFMLFVCVREQRRRAQTPPMVMLQDKTYTLRPAKARNLSTMFGTIRYWRSYLHGPGGHGFHPLDVELGLTTDRLSMNVLSLASRLATSDPTPVSSKSGSRPKTFDITVIRCGRTRLEPGASDQVSVDGLHGVGSASARRWLAPTTMCRSW